MPIIECCPKRGGNISFAELESNDRPRALEHLSNAQALTQEGLAIFHELNAMPNSLASERK